MVSKASAPLLCVVLLSGGAHSASAGFYAEDKQDRLARGAERVERCRAELNEQTGDAPGAGRSSSTPPPFWLTNNGAQLCIASDLTRELAEGVEALGERPQYVVMRSGGGLGSAAVRLAERMVEWDAKLVVWDECLSACANGPFLAARERIVPEPAIIGWHGGLARTRFEALLRADDWIARELRARLAQTGQARVSHEEWGRQDKSLRREFERLQPWRDREAALFKRAGVNVHFHGAIHAVRARTPILRGGEDDDSAPLPDNVFWSPPLATLQAWGFKNVTTWRLEGFRGGTDALGVGAPGAPPVVLLNEDVRPEDYPGRREPVAPTGAGELN